MRYTNRHFTYLHYLCNLSLVRRHLVNAYEVKAGIGVIAGKTV